MKSVIECSWPEITGPFCRNGKPMSENQEITAQSRSSEFGFFWPTPSTRMVENLVDMQKFNLELFARHTTTAMDSIRRFFPMIPTAVMDAAQMGVAELFRMQIRVLDSIAGRGKEYLQDHDGHPASGQYDQITRLLSESADQFLAVHRKLVDIFVQQLQSFSAAMGTANITSGVPISFGAEAMQRNSEAIIEAQKRFWGFFLGIGAGPKQNPQSQMIRPR